MKTLLRALLALMPLSIGTACMVLCAALALPVQANAGGPAPAQFKIMHSDRTQLGDDIDVRGMDYGWALVPPEETDFEFMGQWGLAKDVAHAEAALSFVRSIRVDTGQGNGKLHVLGFSYGGLVAYLASTAPDAESPFFRSALGGRNGRSIASLLPCANRCRR